MEENEGNSLDSQYKKYLQIMRPYLGQLLSEDDIEICKAWIQRLSNCKENEKLLRNKYVFTLCYQLAKGILDEPFTRFPSEKELKPLCQDSDSDESTEVECLVINPDNEQTKILYSNQKTPLSVTENFSNLSRSESNIKETSVTSYNSTSLAHAGKRGIKIKHSSACIANIEAVNETSNLNDNFADKLECRANNVIQKLRKIKQENIMLHREVMLLKEESKLHDECDDLHDRAIKIDNTTSAYMHLQDSDTTLNSLKRKLQEVQESRNTLIDTLGSLQDKLDHYDELKKHEIEEIEAKHKLDIIKLKTTLREETMNICDKRIESIKLHYEDIIKDINQKNKIEVENLKTKINEFMEEKEKIIEAKEQEISQLHSRIENIKSQFSAQINSSDKNSLSERANELEKRLHKMEKVRTKNTRAYEIRVANLQREKHLTECSLQLQLLKQRAQVVSEVTDENQTELTTALEKLEGRYKEIIGNVQATAVQRRIQDQLALESLIKTVCDIPNEGPAKDNKTIHRQETLVTDTEAGKYNAAGKVGHVIVCNKSFGDDSAVNNYYLNNQKLEELFGRIHIPQKDTNDNHLKEN